MATTTTTTTTTTAEVERKKLVATINFIEDENDIILDPGYVPILKSKSEALLRVRPKLGIQSTLDDRYIAWDTKEFILKIESIVKKYISYLYDEGILQGHQWTECKIKTNNAAVYVIRNFFTNIIDKAGQSLHVKTRAKQQEDDGNAHQVFNRDQLIALVPQRFVEAILTAAPPSLIGDIEQTPRLQQMVRNHLAELVVAATRSVKTWPAGERLVELPSANLRNLLRPPSVSDRDRSREFFRQFDFTGVHFFGTWITLRSYLENMAEEGNGNPFLRSKLRKPPTHQFLTKLMVMNMWSEKMCCLSRMLFRFLPSTRKLKNYCYHSRTNSKPATKKVLMMIFLRHFETYC